MKKIYLTLLFGLLFKLSFSQCHISGTISSHDQRPTELFFLYGDGHYDIPVTRLLESGNGSFDIPLSIKTSVFAIIRSGSFSQRLLLSPKRDLELNIRVDSAEHITYAGRAAEENRLLHETLRDSVPFFMNYKTEENPYAKISAAEWEPEIMVRIKEIIKTSRAKIDRSAIPETLKSLLKSESVYAFQCHLNDLTNNNMRWAKNPDRDSLLELVMQWAPTPDSAALVSGFYANMITGRQIQYRINKVAAEASQKKLNMQEVIATFFRTPYREIDSLVRLYGERYIVDWFYARNYMPASMCDKLLLNKILDAAYNADFNACFFLLDTMTFHYPKSPYLDIAKKEVRTIREKLLPVNPNKNIRYRTPGTIRSLAELVKPYAGKIVYLDIWGTWCGPCRVEMKYVATLKKRFKDKDIVFLYLDMDDDLKDAAWKKYLSYYGIEGEHYRMTREEIGPIWKEIKAAGGKGALYPTFVLFDRTGKIIDPDAERPTSMEKLYAQLDKVLQITL